MYDANGITKLVACLRYLRLEPTMETFERRKKAQKLAYLLQVFGINLSFRFNWYLHGPYSSELTLALYDAKRAGNSISQVRYSIGEQDKKRLENLKLFLGADIESAETLELLVSLHYLLTVARKENASDEEALRILKESKPFFSEEEIRRCYLKIKQIL